MAAPAAESLKGVLDALLAGKSLGEEEAYEAMNMIAKGAVDSHQVAAMLVLLKAKGETSEEIAGLAKSMREKVASMPIPDVPLLDVVGTGGDGHDTVNISTSAAILSGACGAKVAKHGNISVSSKSGSADVLRALGVAMLPPAGIKECVDEAGMAFMFAPLFHPAMKHVVPVRRALKVRTVFNILGPLLNPANAQHLMLGVYSLELLPIYGEALARLGAKHALVVHCQGLDELAPIGVANTVEIRDGVATPGTIDASKFGVPSCTIADLKGGDAETNAGIISKVFSGEAADSAIGHTIALNAGAALYVYDKVGSVADGYKLALEKLKSGEVLPFLGKLKEVSTRIMAGLEEKK